MPADPDWSLRGAHAGCIDEFFRVTIDLTAGTSLGFVDVKRATFHDGNDRRRQADFVLYWLAVVGQLQVRG